jgi:hypothetical protein
LAVTLRVACLRIQSFGYTDEWEFARDVRLVFRNALAYNPKGHFVFEAAKQLAAEFDADFTKAMARKAHKQSQMRFHCCNICRGHTCSLCGEKCLKFDPPVS